MPDIPHMDVSINPGPTPGSVVVVFTEKALDVKLIDPHRFNIAGDTLLQVVAQVIIMQGQLRQQLGSRLLQGQ